MSGPAFHQRVIDNLAKGEVRANFRRAMDGLIARRQDQFPDKGELRLLRREAMSIRANALSKLPQLLLQLEQQCQQNGIKVHWAEDANEGNRIILDILRSHGVKSLVKGKSMVTEEMGLNHFLEGHGIEALESDLGEFIIQLAKEPPSHIVMPAIHKNRVEIARLFNEKFPDIPYTEDIDELTRTARRILREKFMSAAAGISGVNFAVAESGTLCLVENEGNGRMATTVPPLHIAVTGIEKVVERLRDVPPLLSILTRSATGQPITTYFNMITSARREGEQDGPQELHLVLLDNGRANIYSDPELQETLRCIRCGACMNHCPVYVRIGGHGYGTVYPGPIGTILEPQLNGLVEHGDLVSASTLCGACRHVCPVEIPIPNIINRLRFDRVRQDGRGAKGSGSGYSRLEALIWGLWSWLASRPRLYNLAMASAARLRRLTPSRLGGWTRTRSAPRPAKQTLHQRMKREGVSDE